MQLGRQFPYEYTPGKQETADRVLGLAMTAAVLVLFTAAIVGILYAVGVL